MAITRTSSSLSSIEIERALGRRAGLIFFGLPQQLFELLLTNLFAAEVRSEAFLKHLVAPIGFPFELLDGRLQILDSGLFLRLVMLDDNLGFRIDLQGRTAARAFYFEKARHRGIVAALLEPRTTGIQRPVRSNDMESVLAWLSHYGYAGLFALLMLGIVGLPVPDETLLVFSGYLISTGRLHALPAFAAALAGSMCGISLSYTIGRSLGHAMVLRYGRFLHITEDPLARVHRWFERAGEWLLTIGYFIPGVRHFTALVAGTSELEYRRFALFAYPGAAVWVSTFLAVGYFVGDHWRSAMELVHRYTLLFAVVLLVAVAALWWIRRRRPLSH